MPHINVKLWPGTSEPDKKKLAEALTKTAMDILGNGETSFSVSIEDVAPSHWKDNVYLPEIIEKPKILYKKPGYTMD